MVGVQTRSNRANFTTNSRPRPRLEIFVFAARIKGTAWNSLNVARTAGGRRNRALGLRRQTNAPPSRYSIELLNSGQLAGQRDDLDVEQADAARSCTATG
jgi:hypothetical protein